jgi:hypothetical protein
MWRANAALNFTLPPAVTRKRFFAPLLVFIFGIFFSFEPSRVRPVKTTERARQCQLARPHPFWKRCYSRFGPEKSRFFGDFFETGVNPKLWPKTGSDSGKRRHDYEMN